MTKSEVLEEELDKARLEISALKAENKALLRRFEVARTEHTEALADRERLYKIMTDLRNVLGEVMDIKRS
ncbi:hypothetical protein [Leadbettera azotonutricia]|uniref:Uncharacterized protein n=1 Tax=Leadbettera azotonutricia (strain ATCC BAA-888 / DSM 13862 / ZAS-9) TaxID=545695 RepID=F5Y9S9_LEAAZ|nr:hypothetical protein [Leadbettera azotonutricia]AEF81414.1 hypothetical protein TREAZ_3191 [Leadbettera azotonutricia ZAS-9]